MKNIGRKERYRKRIEQKHPRKSVLTHIKTKMNHQKKWKNKITKLKSRGEKSPHQAMSLLSLVDKGGRSRSDLC